MRWLAGWLAGWLVGRRHLQAEVAFARVLKLAPDRHHDVIALANSGILRLQRGDLASAAHMLQLAEELNPAHRQVHALRQLLRQDGHSAGASASN